MPASNTDYSKIKQYQEQAASLTSQGAGVEASAGTLGDAVMKAVRDARTARGVSKLATDVGNVSGQMVTDPTGIRGRTSGMVDPFSVNALTSNARAQNLRTLGTISTQQTENQQPIDEVIQAGANKLKAQAAQLYAQAQEAETQSKALQDEWTRAMEERKQSFTESQAGNTGEFIIPESQPTQPTEPMPNYSPGVKNTVSAGGQWIFTGTGTTGWEALGGGTGTGSSGYSIDQINTAIQQAATAGNTKAVTMWKGVLTSTISSQKAQQPVKGSALMQRDANNATSGLTQISNIKAWVEEDPGLISRVQIPLLGGMGQAGKMKKALKEVQDIYTRLRTGAALNNEEIAFYESQIAPNLINIADPTSFNYGLDLAESFFAGIAGKNDSQSQSQSLGDILGE